MAELIRCTYREHYVHKKPKFVVIKISLKSRSSKKINQILKQCCTTVNTAAQPQPERQYLRNC